MGLIQSVYGLDTGQVETIFGLKAAIIWVLLFAFGLFYKWLVYEYLPEVKGVKNRTAELVVGGVLVTLLGYGFIIGDAVVRGGEALVAVLVCFACSGIPMIVGYWSKDAQNDAEEEKRKAEDERRAKDQINKRAKITAKKDE